jgi:hypothetical protein
MSWSYRCPLCSAEPGKCAHAEIAGNVKLEPCAFCQGPPVVFDDSQVHGFKFAPEGSLVSAHVFCHECGAQGPREDDLAWEAGDVRPLRQKVVLLWNARNARHRRLYDAGDASGLNYYPRLERAKATQ